MRPHATAYSNPPKTTFPAYGWWALVVACTLTYAIITHYTVPLNISTDYQLKMDKSSGRNDPHANQQAREKAQQEYEKVRDELQEWNRKPNKTPDDKKFIEKLRKLMERLRKKKDFTGETHSRKSKGN
jgi:hypothetical protein